MPKSSESKSPDFYRFFRVIDFEKACPRRMVWYMLEIEGKPQYYYNKLIYERGKVFEHLLTTFPKASGSTELERMDEVFKDKFEEEDGYDLFFYLDSMISANAIEITEVNKKIDYSLTNPPIRLYCDAVGTFDGDDALFKLNMTQRFKKDDAYELVLVENMVNPGKKKNYRLITLQLGEGKYREIFENGDRNQDGSLSKRGLQPWTNLKDEIDENLKENFELIKKMEIDPICYDIPLFGTCGTCPYHNVEVVVHRQKVTCLGGL